MGKVETLRRLQFSGISQIGMTWPNKQNFQNKPIKVENEN